jgi:putative SOS response-associated peptidase YedK
MAVPIRCLIELDGYYKWSSDSNGVTNNKFMKHAYDTTLLLFARQIYQRFGVVTSFKGAYRRNRWSLELWASNQTFDNGTFLVRVW